MKLLVLILTATAALADEPAKPVEIPWKLQAEYYRAQAQINYVVSELLKPAQEQQGVALKAVADLCGGIDKVDRTKQFLACIPKPANPQATEAQP